MGLWTRSERLSIPFLRSLAVCNAQLCSSESSSSQSLTVPTEQIPLKPKKDDSSNLPILQNKQSISDAPKKVAAKGGRKANKSAVADQPFLEETIQPETNTTNNAELLEVDPNDGRRKRRKTASPDGKETTEGYAKDNEDVSPAPRKRGRSRPIPMSVPVEAAEEVLLQPGPDVADNAICPAPTVSSK